MKIQEPSRCAYFGGVQCSGSFYKLDNFFFVRRGGCMLLLCNLLVMDIGNLCVRGFIELLLLPCPNDIQEAGNSSTVPHV